MPSAKDIRISKLFHKGGPLYGKSGLTWPIADVDPVDERTFILKSKIKGQTNLEESMKLTALKILGWPEPSPGDNKADMVYQHLGMILECDEPQHYDPGHIFNTRKPRPFDMEQNARDLRVNQHYLNQGYYIIRLRACYREIYTPIKGKDKGKLMLKWSTFSLGEIGKFTKEAIQFALEKRKVAIQNGDYRGKLIVYPETSTYDTKTERSPLFPQFNQLPMPAYAYDTIFHRARIEGLAQPIPSDTMQGFLNRTAVVLEEVDKDNKDYDRRKQLIDDHLQFLKESQTGTSEEEENKDVIMNTEDPEAPDQQNKLDDNDDDTTINLEPPTKKPRYEQLFSYMRIIGPKYHETWDNNNDKDLYVMNLTHQSDRNQQRNIAAVLSVSTLAVFVVMVVLLVVFTFPH